LRNCPKSQKRRERPRLRMRPGDDREVEGGVFAAVDDVAREAAERNGSFPPK